jgi:hypothetical protein
MIKEVILQNYFSTFSDINLVLFLSDMVLATILSFILKLIYVRFGSSISNKKSFSSNFIPLTLTTFLVISIIKSSLALSLGLVGALSIVRFRAAIKEPEELTYLFLCISLGLGFGAEQRYMTLLAFSLITVILVFRGMVGRKTLTYSNLFLSFPTGANTDIKKLIDLLPKYTSSSTLRRLDQKDKSLEILIGAQFKNTNDFLRFKETIIENYKDAEISFYEDKGILN